MAVPLYVRHLIVAFALSEARWMKSVVGPYFMVFDKIRSCELGENGYDGSTRWTITFSHFNPYKRDELQTSSTNFTYSLPFNDSYWQRVVFDIWSNNEWKPNAIVLNYPSKACSMMKQNRGEYFAHVFKQDADGGCFIPNGTYYVANQDPRMMKFPQLPYARYRILTTNGLPWRKGCMQCAYFEVDIIPK